MQRIAVCVIGLSILFTVACPAQERLYSLTVSGSFTTSSKLFHHPNDPDELIRSQFLPIHDLVGVGIDIRRSIESMRIQVGLSVEYISKKESFSLPISGADQPVPVKDGFTAVPIELSGYFIIPVGNETIQLFMGGGGGMYIGARQYQYADVSAPAIDRKVGYGIHVLSGLQYALKPTLSLRSELKFRDIQFESVNKFTASTAAYRGRIIALDQSPFPSRISIDDMTLTLSLAFHF